MVNCVNDVHIEIGFRFEQIENQFMNCRSTLLSLKQHPIVPVRDAERERNMEQDVADHYKQLIRVQDEELGEVRKEPLPMTQALLLSLPFTP